MRRASRGPRLADEIGAGAVVGDRYRVLRHVGRGGMGSVFAALDLLLHRRVAIKLLRGDLIARQSGDSWITTEGRLLARLNHPGVVRIYEVGSHRSCTYLVTELVDGESIADLLRGLRQRLGPATARARWRSGRDLAAVLDRPLPDGVPDLLLDRSWCRTVARIATEVAEAVDFIHRHGVIHRDVKAGNVILRGGGHPVLIDFSVGDDIGRARDGRSDRLSGSLSCLAPEQARDKRNGSDPRTDVYQLGLLLYEMMTLRRPFPAASIAATLDRIAQGRFPRPRAVDPTLSRGLERICLKAMAVDPDVRYSTAGALATELAAFAARGANAPIDLPRVCDWALGVLGRRNALRVGHA